MNEENLHKLMERQAKKLERAVRRNTKKVVDMKTKAWLARFPFMHKIIPEGKHGKASVTHFTITKEQSEMTLMRSLYNPDTRWYNYVSPGTYAELKVDGRLFMSDTDHERAASADLVFRAHGHVLISGLGLGMVLFPLLTDKRVKSVTVLEVEPDVIAYIGPHVEHKKLTIHEADVFQWKPNGQAPFDVVFHDIWPSINPDNLAIFAQLKRRYRKWMNKENPDRWQYCWSEDLCRKLRREELKMKQELKAIERLSGSLDGFETD